MAETTLDDVQSAIQTFWSKQFMQELRQSNIIMSLVNRDYTGDLKKAGDRVRVNQINAPTGQTLSIDGAGGDRTFTPSAVDLSTVDVVADSRFVASYDFDDSVILQSLIDPFGEMSVEIRAALVYAMNVQINDYIYGKIAPTTTIGSVTTLDAATVATVRENAGKSKWDKRKSWYSTLSPEYYADLLQDTTFTNADFGAEDRPVIGGQFAIQRYGFNLLEDNSIDADTIETGAGLFFHPDWFYWVMQMEPRFKISDKHSNNEYAYVKSVDLVAGGGVGIDGADKHILVKPTYCLVFKNLRKK